MARKDANAGAREIQEERRLQAFELRKAGMSFRAIGKQLGVSDTQAHRDVMTVLRRLAKQTDKEAREYRQMQLERIEEMITAIWVQARGSRKRSDTGEIEVTPPDLAAMDRLMRLMEREARLLALDLEPEKDKEDREYTINVVYKDKKDVE